MSLKIECIVKYQEFLYHLYKEISTGTTLREWENRINTKADSIANDEERNKFKGDMLEIFSEIFFNQYSVDSAIGIASYTPIDIEHDFGVDATGFNANGSKVAIQCKYRTNPEATISYGDIAKTFTSGVTQYNIDPSMNNTIVLFTNCKGANYINNAVLDKRLKVISQEHIKDKVDNNSIFWCVAYTFIIKTLEEYETFKYIDELPSEYTRMYKVYNNGE